MEDKLRYVAVDFVDDANVAGSVYWYLCGFKVSAGDCVIAPLGRHNNLQKGVVRRVVYCDEYCAPYPLYLTKSVKGVVREEGAEK